MTAERALVTGAASPLGMRIVEGLADEFSIDCLVRPDTDEERLRRLRGLGQEVWLKPCDLGDQDEVVSLLNRLDERRGLSLLVNAACAWSPGPISGLTSGQIYEEVAASVAGTICLTRGLLPKLEATENSRIINICSTVGSGYDFSTNTLYVGLKGAIDGFGRALRRELGGRVRVTNVYCGQFADGDDADPMATPLEDVAKAIDFVRSQSSRTSVDAIVITPASMRY